MAPVQGGCGVRPSVLSNGCGNPPTGAAANFLAAVMARVMSALVQDVGGVTGHCQVAGVARSTVSLFSQTPRTKESEKCITYQ
jgi:hypothetical protein